MGLIVLQDKYIGHGSMEKSQLRNLHLPCIWSLEMYKLLYFLALKYLCDVLLTSMMRYFHCKAGYISVGEEVLLHTWTMMSPVTTDNPLM